MELKIKSPILRSALLLMLFALVGTLLVSVSHYQTRDQIRINERLALLRSMNELLPADQYDNELLTDTVALRSQYLLGSDKAITFYRARKQGKPLVVLFTPIAVDGYSGSIKFLIAITYQGRVLGVRIISHTETPGLGDKIEQSRSNWVTHFSNKSLGNPDAIGWAVQRDGGDFPQLTGATITPRAIVKAIYKSLVFFKSHRDELFKIQQIIDTDSNSEKLNNH